MKKASEHLQTPRNRQQHRHQLLKEFHMLLDNPQQLKLYDLEQRFYKQLFFLLYKLQCLCQAI
jgi:hypothetical protein